MAQAPGSESDGLGGGEHSAQTRREIVPGSFVRVVCVLVIPRTHAMAGGSRCAMDRCICAGRRAGHENPTFGRFYLSLKKYVATINTLDLSRQLGVA